MIDHDEIKKMTGDIQRISEAEKGRLDTEITMNEVSQCLKNTCNIIAPGPGAI